ncbi:hemoglobin subunit beta-1-like isoform X2 [Hippoglossus stenolepis]|uniref:hemoglobin subunit beta-1-like isoform X2 n=1 Tax=Hippoglossus stenolepis TaxID=195615 RepID=UPI00159CC324|nr:hemoglobin subunit beta-1-like isoform X2 [Hippoglossus stenolepis]
MNKVYVRSNFTISDLGYNTLIHINLEQKIIIITDDTDAMVKWTDQERSTIRAVWEQINIDEVGAEALARVLIVYPWTERYFGSFGEIFTASAVLNNAKVAAHGRLVLRTLDEAVKNMDNIKDTSWPTASPSPSPANSGAPWALRSKPPGRSFCLLW